VVHDAGRDAGDLKFHVSYFQIKENQMNGTPIPGGATAAQLSPQLKANGLLGLVSSHVATGRRIAQAHAAPMASYRRRIVTFIFSNPDGLSAADAAALFGVGAAALIADAGVIAPVGCTITPNPDGTIAVTAPAKA
jgi:hypothetical protein